MYLVKEMTLHWSCNQLQSMISITDWQQASIVFFQLRKCRVVLDLGYEKNRFCSVYSRANRGVQIFQSTAYRCTLSSKRYDINERPLERGDEKKRCHHFTKF